MGNESAALRAIRRRPYHWGPAMVAAAAIAREEGRIAALTGDREGAIWAYRTANGMPCPGVPRVARLVPATHRQLTPALVGVVDDDAA